MTDARVRRGMAVLDHFSPDWEYRIRPDQVTSIKDATRCILCAVFGTYARGLAAVGMHGDLVPEPSSGRGQQILDCGFCPPGFPDEIDEDVALTAAWQSAIRERIQETQTSAYEVVFEEGFA